MLPNLLTPARAESWRRAQPATPKLVAPTTHPDRLRLALYAAAVVLWALLGTLGAKYHWLPQATSAAPPAATAFVGARP